MTLAEIVALPGATPVTGNVVAIAPACIEIVAGTVATAALLLERAIVVVADGADVSDTVPCAVPPGAMVDVFNVTAMLELGAVGVVELEH